MSRSNNVSGPSPLLALNFDKIYCLNLVRRYDRRALAQMQFDSIGLPIEFFAAIDGPKLGLKHPVLSPGMVGCYESHKAILQEAIEKGYERVLVFEDDLKLAPGFNQFLQLSLAHIPADWEFIYLGYSQYDGMNAYKEKINSFWTVPGFNWGTQAYMVQGKETFKKLYEGLQLKNWQIDQQLTYEVLPYNNIKYYAHYPSLVGQNGSATDVQTQRVPQILL